MRSRVHYLLLIYFPLKLDLVVLKPEANSGSVNNLHIYGEHLTPDSLEENKGNQKYMALRFLFSQFHPLDKPYLQHPFDFVFLTATKTLNQNLQRC